MEDGMTFGQKVRELRLKIRLSQKELAATVGMEVTYLSKIETGRLPPPSEPKIRAIAQALKGDYDELVRLAEKLPEDIPDVIQQSPKIPQFLRKARELPDEDWDELIRIVERMRGENR